MVKRRSQFRQKSIVMSGLPLVLLLTALILSACSPSPTSPADSETAADGAATDAPVVIGLVSPHSQSGQDRIVDAVAMAVEKVNADGGVKGRPVELLTADSGGDPEQARRAALKLIEAGAVGLVGAYYSEETLAVMEVAADHEKPLLIPVSATDEIPEKIVTDTHRYRHVFRVGYSLTQWARMMGDFLLHQGFDNYAYVGSSSIKWNEEYARHFAAYLEPKGIESVLPDQFYSYDSPDLEEIAAVIGEARPEIVILGDQGPLAAQLAKLIRGADLNMALFSVAGSPIGKTIEPLPLGELYFQAAAWHRPGESAGDFFTDFQSTYGYAAVGYSDIIPHDAAMVLMGALEAAPEWDSDVLAATIADGQFPAAAGTYSFSGGHQAQWEVGSPLSGDVVQWVTADEAVVVWP